MWTNENRGRYDRSRLRYVYTTIVPIWELLSLKGSLPVSGQLPLRYPGVARSN
jgi:hypothetical protein